ncbi:MAG: hypothetical protein LLF89_10175 [Spirochaetaceae bacterium]|nr:hypothetical protein [Spirochaetaceae bacterium]
MSFLVYVQSDPLAGENIGVVLLAGVLAGSFFYDRIIKRSSSKTAPAYNKRPIYANALSIDRKDLPIPFSELVWVPIASGYTAQIVGMIQVPASCRAIGYSDYMNYLATRVQWMMDREEDEEEVRRTIRLAESEAQLPFILPTTALDLVWSVAHILSSMGITHDFRDGMSPVKPSPDPDALETIQDTSLEYWLHLLTYPNER